MWRHALAVAVAAVVMLPSDGRDARIGAFVPALLHDVGRVTLGAADAMTAAAIDRVAAAQGTQRSVVERDWYGFDHGSAGAAVAEDLGLAPEECDAIAAHHRPTSVAGAARTLALTINAADALAWAIGCGVGDTRPTDVTAGSAGLHGEAEARARARLRDELARWHGFLA